MIKVFLSHNSADKHQVEELAKLLYLEDGIEPWLDKWNLIPGDPWQEAIEQALEACKVFLCILGKAEFGPWQHEEMRGAIARRVENNSKRVIPVLLPGAEWGNHKKLPPFLSRSTWVEFHTSFDEQDNYHRLLSGIRGLPPGPNRERISEKNNQSIVRSQLKNALSEKLRCIIGLFNTRDVRKRECEDAVRMLTGLESHFENYFKNDQPALYRIKDMVFNAKTKIRDFQPFCRIQNEQSEERRKSILFVLRNIHAEV